MAPSVEAARMSFKPEYQVANDTEWHDNSLRFSREEEATKCAQDFYDRSALAKVSVVR
jgi:hypothetical protein